MKAAGDNPNRWVSLHSCGGYHDRRLPCLLRDTRPLVSIAAVEVTEFKDRDGALVDRRIQVVLICGCRYDQSLPLDAAVSIRAGEPARCRSTCNLIWDRDSAA